MGPPTANLYETQYARRGLQLKNSFGVKQVARSLARAIKPIKVVKL